jgi:hypothetical protein
MPGRDGTGPAMNGGFGFRNTSAAYSPRRMFARCRFTNINRPYGCRYASSKEALATEKELLERRLAEINESPKQ